MFQWTRPAMGYVVSSFVDKDALYYVARIKAQFISGNSSSGCQRSLKTGQQWSK
jgi:hypothetical protein